MMQPQHTPLSPAQLKCISTLVSKLGIDKDYKALLVEAFSAGQTTTSKEMTMDDARAMILHLKSLQPGEKSRTRMRNRIIANLMDMGYTIPGPKKPRPDMPRIDTWCLEHTGAGKKLDAMDHKELQSAVTSANAFLSYFLKKF